MTEPDYDAWITREPERTKLDEAFEQVGDLSDQQLVDAYLNRHDSLPDKVRESLEDVLAHDLENDWSQP
jgi:hypothetical protein